MRRERGWKKLKCLCDALLKHRIWRVIYAVYAVQNCKLLNNFLYSVDWPGWCLHSAGPGQRFWDFGFLWQPWSQQSGLGCLGLGHHRHCCGAGPWPSYSHPPPVLAAAGWRAINHQPWTQISSKLSRNQSSRILNTPHLCSSKSSISRAIMWKPRCLGGV